jgi:2-aminoadipate transaminase
VTFPYALSGSALRIRPSPIRELFAMTRRPGMISFAGGWPDPAIFPVAEFAEGVEVLSRLGPEVLQYGATEGYAPLVEELCRWLTPRLGRTPAPAELVVTTGSQQVVDLLGRVLIDPGDVVVVEAPTYPGALHTLRNLGARFAVVPCDGGGMPVDRLAEVLERCRSEQGRPPKLIYTIVNFANPSGACLAADRRPAVLDLARRHGVPVLEDDPYGELRFRGEALPSLYSLAGGEGVVWAGSFSKVLAPGVRVAWAVGEAEIIRSVVLVKQGVDLCTSVVSQALTAEYCRRGHLERHLGKIRAHYAAKAAAMSAALAATLPPGRAAWQDPDGGFFFWLRLPECDSRVLFRRAVERGVAFLPGAAFFPDPAETVGAPVDGAPFARLCFTFATPDEIVEGCRRLAAALS